MSLFKKKAPKAPKAPKVKSAPKKQKGKKSMFGGKKKELTLLERMQLEESVAASSLDVLGDHVEYPGSAVREVPEGFLIVAITNEMLENSGVEASSEEFGSFAEALRKETIESITLAGDLARGVIGILPSADTVMALDEYDFIHDIPLKWALVPKDLDDDDMIKILDNSVSLETLQDMAEDQTITASLDGLRVIIGGKDEQDDDRYDDEREDSSYEQDGIEDDEDEFDGPGIDDEDDDEFEPSYPEYGEDAEEDDVEDYGSYNEYDASFDESDDMDELPASFSTDEPDVDDGLMEDLQAEEHKEIVKKALNHGFNNTELDLTVSMELFDDYFDSIRIVQFDTPQHDNSELHRTIARMSQNANAELAMFHNENIKTLRNSYTTNMREIHNKLVDALDHQNSKTVYGEKHQDIETKYNRAMSDMDRIIHMEAEKINKVYEMDRNDFADKARQEALLVYDSRYKETKDRKIFDLKEQIKVEIKTKRDTSIGDLFSDRRIVAKRLFDKYTTSLLQKLQEEHQKMSQKELQMYDAFRKDMDSYLRRHFADEVLRAKAEAEKLRQSHEAERVRAEYDQMLTAKTRQLEEAGERAREALAQLELSHKDQISHVRADYERRIEKEQKDNENLRNLLSEATRGNSKISEEKEKEIESRIRMYEHTIQAKDMELKYANDRASQAQKPLMYVTVAVAAIMLALGVIFGFVYGASQSLGTPSGVAPGGNQTTAHVEQIESTDSLEGYFL